MSTSLNIGEILKKAGLKVTPQRSAVLEAVYTLRNHPTAENVAEFIREKHPNIAIGTIYNVLEKFVEKNLIKKVKTENDIMRYDGITDEHHHLYSIDSNRIEDYYDDELNELLRNHFASKQIPNFEIEDIKLQIKGKFIK